MKPEFEVWGKHIAQSCPKVIVRRNTREEAEAEAERLRNMRPVRHLDGLEQPVYSDVTVKPELTAAELAIDWCFPWTMVKP